MPFSASVPLGFSAALLAQATSGGAYWDNFFNHALATIVYALLGLLIFGLAFAGIVRLCPFSVRKEIEEDQNTSLAIIIGAVFIGIAIIIGAAVHG